MPDDSFTFTRDTAHRVLRAMAWVERRAKLGPDTEAEGNPDTPNHQFVLLDGDNEEGGGIRYWSGVVKIWDANNDVWDTGTAIWAFSPTGRTLSENVYYAARQSGDVDPTSADERPLFIVSDTAECSDDIEVPKTFTATEACYFDIVESRCIDNDPDPDTTEYRLTRIYFPFLVTVLQGAWSTTNPPTPP